MTNIQKAEQRIIQCKISRSPSVSFKDIAFTSEEIKQLNPLIEKYFPNPKDRPTIIDLDLSDTQLTKLPENIYLGSFNDGIPHGQGTFNRKKSKNQKSRPEIVNSDIMFTSRSAFSAANASFSNNRKSERQNSEAEIENSGTTNMTLLFRQYRNSRNNKNDKRVGVSFKELKSGAKKIKKFVKNALQRKPNEETEGIFKGEEKGLLSYDSLYPADKDNRPIMAVGVPADIGVGIPVDDSVIELTNSGKAKPVTNPNEEEANLLELGQHFPKVPQTTPSNENADLLKLDQLLPEAPNTNADLLKLGDLPIAPNSAIQARPEETNNNSRIKSRKPVLGR